MYALVSFNEYVTHRYYQHGEFNTSPNLQRLYCKITGKEEAPMIKVRVYACARAHALTWTRAQHASSSCSARARIRDVPHNAHSLNR